MMNVHFHTSISAWQGRNPKPGDEDAFANAAVARSNLCFSACIRDMLRNEQAQSLPRCSPNLESPTILYVEVAGMASLDVYPSCARRAFTPLAQARTSKRPALHVSWRNRPGTWCVGEASGCMPQRPAVSEGGPRQFLLGMCDLGASVNEVFLVF